MLLCGIPFNTINIMKKILLQLLFLLAMSLSTSANQYFISTSGNDVNSGTIESPFASFDKAYGLVNPGDTIYVRGGKYNLPTMWKLDKPGNVQNYYKLWAYPADLARKDSVILNAGATNGIRITSVGSYWYVKGFVIQNSSDNGMRIEGSHNIVENCIFRYNSDSGLAIQQSNGTLPNDGSIAGYNLILNCDSYYNYKNVDNADGFACKLSPGAGNVFRGCRSWANGDDGWDFYYTRFQIIVEDCWTFRNGIQGGNGNGFKSNGSASSSSTPRTQAPHVYVRCISFDHKYKSGANNKGFDQNHNEGNVSMINCLAFDNEKNFAYQEDCNPKAENGTINGTKHVFRNCVGFEPYSEKYARTLVPGEVINAGTKDEISYKASNTWFGTTIDDQYNSWNLFPETAEGVPSRNDYVSLSMEDAMAPREIDGSLPNNGFGRLKSDSKLIDKGVSYSFVTDKIYPDNINNPAYVPSTLITSLDGMPDLGPFESPKPYNENNQLPVVSLTSPEDGTIFEAGNNIQLSATASDVDGQIVRIEFYAGTRLLGTINTTPYIYLWSNAIAGNYSICAKVYDNQGGTTLSLPVNITVKDKNENSIGETQSLLKLSCKNGYQDEIVNKAWTTTNSVSSSTKGFKLNYSSSKGGTLISPIIDMNKYQVQELNLEFCSSGGGNRNLNIYLSTDGGKTFGSSYTQSGGANGATISVKLNLSDKLQSESSSFVIKLEAANTIEIWNIEVLGAEKGVTGINKTEYKRTSILCVPTVTSDFTSVIFNLPETMPVQIGLYNLNGQFIKQVAYNNWYPAGENSVLTDISNFVSGTYICVVKYGNEIKYSKIVKL